MHFWKGSAQSPLVLTCYSRRESSGHVWERRFKSQHYSVRSSWRVGRSGCGWGAGVSLVARVTRPRQDPRTGTRRGSSGLNLDLDLPPSKAEGRQQISEQQHNTPLPTPHSGFFTLATPKSHLDFISLAIPFNCLIS